LVIKIGDDKNFKQEIFQVDKITRYWGGDGALLGDGLRYPGFKVGAEVWFVVGTGGQSRTILEFRLCSPVLPPGNLFVSNQRSLTSEPEAQARDLV